MIMFLFKIILAFCLNYYVTSRFLYDYEINGRSSTPFTIEPQILTKNKVCKIIFPREFKNPREFLEGVTKISIIGLVHFFLFYLPVQITYLISVVFYFKDKNIADNISNVVFKVMFIGFTFFLIATLLSDLVFNVKNLFNKKRSKK